MTVNDRVAVIAEVADDFLARMEAAASKLEDLAEDAYLLNYRENVRLRGKAEGIRLAMSYWRDSERHFVLTHSPRVEGDGIYEDIEVRCEECGALNPARDEPCQAREATDG